jgi:hypothetical protein
VISLIEPEEISEKNFHSRDIHADKAFGHFIIIFLPVCFSDDEIITNNSTILFLKE